MSVEASAIVLHHSRAAGTAKVVLTGIANHDGDGGSWPSIATLAKYARVTERNVQVALKKLEKLGEIRIHLQAGGDRRTDPRYRSNRYEILVSCPDDCDRTSKHRSIHDRCLPAEHRGLGVVPDCDDEGCRTHHPSGVSIPTPLTLVRGVDTDVQGVSPATPEPSLNHPETPQPPASGGRPSSTTCSKPGPTPHANCRGCGTTNRQRLEQRRIDAAAAARVADQERLAAERAKAAKLSVPSSDPAAKALLEQTRQQLARSRP